MENAICRAIFLGWCHWTELELEVRRVGKKWKKAEKMKKMTHWKFEKNIFPQIQVKMGNFQKDKCSVLIGDLLTIVKLCDCLAGFSTIGVEGIEELYFFPFQL